ncbi:hypothetical protein [Devosia sp. DBB001]|nr:hypothetical protein [Devosia sp. DBB001]
MPFALTNPSAPPRRSDILGRSRIGSFPWRNLGISSPHP